MTNAFDSFLDNFAHPSIDYRPELRWWLAEGLHTDRTLRAEIAEAHRLGFGGMEFLAMDDAGIDHARYGWGSEEWTHDSGIVVEETTARGMSVSFTSGTNWSNANLPTITPDDRAASQELNFTVEVVSGSRSGPLASIDLVEDGEPIFIPGERVVPNLQRLVAVVASPAPADGSALVNPAETVVLTDLVTGDRVLDSRAIDETAAPSLDWTAPDGRNWRLFVFWMHGTGQTAEPSSTTNVTINYLDHEGVDAVINYWSEVVLTPELEAEIARNSRAQMYMDSLELNVWGHGGMFWGFCLAEEFEQRRGYSIIPWLPLLVRSVPMMACSTVYRYEGVPTHRIEVEKVRHDYVKTLTDLYIEHMLRPFAEFLHSRGILLRAEISYGLPFELTRPGPEVDGIETESLEFGSQIDAYRLLAGPAHLFGKQYSSETGATSRNHMLDHRFYDQIIATQLAAGVTKTVLHGWSSIVGPEGTTHWPGHEGMYPAFSERFDSRQPSAEFYPMWTEALARLQYALRQGRPRIDVGILYTDHFVDNMAGTAFGGAEGNRVPDEDAYGRWWMRNRENHWWEDLGMQDAGLTYEFFDGSLLTRPEVSFDGNLVQPEGPGYQALLVFQEALDADVASLLLKWARRGLRLLLVHGARSVRFLQEGLFAEHERAASRTPGLDGRDGELAAMVAELVDLPTVVEVDSPDGTVDALRSLGVVGRAEFAHPNRSILTHVREDGNLVHVFAYHFLYESEEPSDVEIRVPGRGAVSRLDQWTGRARPHAGVRYCDERLATFVSLRLAPGEIALLTIDRSAEPAESAPADLAVLAAIDEWDIAVESWDAGPNEVIEEDRGLGYVSREVRPTTAITRLLTPSRTLSPWKDLEGIGPEVSGIGEYHATVTLDAVPEGRIVLDLGSTCGGLGSVTINGSEARGFDTSRPLVDVTGLVHSGANNFVVRTASSLNNRLLARGYYESVPDLVALLSLGIEQNQTTHVRDHGLVGPVRLLCERE